jgi:uncharacterized protein YukJ
VFAFEGDDNAWRQAGQARPDDLALALSDQLEQFIRRAIQEPDATVYAFGQRWGPEPQMWDKIFNFLPGLCIHDIHMNQGNVPPFLGDDGVWQDGGRVLQFLSMQQWVAIALLDNKGFKVDGVAYTGDQAKKEGWTLVF